jgi:hypothetical protein
MVSGDFLQEEKANINAPIINAKQFRAVE